MTDTKASGNGTSQTTPPASRQVQVRVVGQYIKDLSFENPGVGKPADAADKPNLRIEVNVNGGKTGERVYESALQFRAEASVSSGVLYVLELVYAGMFEIENMPEEALEQFLLINCPTLIFPFARRLIADLTREGGFPPLLLDPIDFGALYLHRQQQAQAQKPITA